MPTTGDTLEILYDHITKLFDRLEDDIHAKNQQAEQVTQTNLVMVGIALTVVGFLGQSNVGIPPERVNVVRVLSLIAAIVLICSTVLAIWGRRRGTFMAATKYPEVLLNDIDRPATEVKTELITYMSHTYKKNLESLRIRSITIGGAVNLQAVAMVLFVVSAGSMLT